MIRSFALLAWACAPPPAVVADPMPAPLPPPVQVRPDPDELPPNLLVLVADDVGITPLASTWPAGPSAVTPTLDALADAGMRFDNAYANPTCTPTRFSALTGRFGRRRGIGRPLLYDDPFEAPVNESTLAERLAGAGYTSIALGKWHLSTDASPASYDHPWAWGFEHHGFLQRLDYDDYLRTDDGVLSIDPRYQTTALADDLVKYAADTPEPWLLWAGALAAHLPMHDPPDALYPGTLTAESTRLDQFHAMIAALDTELGRALDAMDPEVRARTIVVFLGDNGTITEFLPEGWEPPLGKGNPYEGGVRVPLFVSGPGIRAGTRHEGLVQVADLFPTLLELGGVDPDGFSVSTAPHWDDVVEGAPTPWLDDWQGTDDPVVIDGVSFAPVLRNPLLPTARRYVYTERFWPNGPPPYPNDLLALRDDRFKIVDRGEGVELYDLADRLDDGPDLLLGDEPLEPDAVEALDRLTAVLAAHQEVLTYEPPR